MRKILDTNGLLMDMQCDKCKRKLKVEKGIIQEGVFTVDYTWGYFSKKDGEIHSIDLCEECYDKIMQENGIEIAKKENTEFI